MDGLDEIRAALEQLSELHYRILDVQLTQGDDDRIQERLEYIERKLERELKRREKLLAQYARTHG